METQPLKLAAGQDLFRVTDGLLALLREVPANAQRTASDIESLVTVGRPARRHAGGPGIRIRLAVLRIRNELWTSPEALIAFVRDTKGHGIVLPERIWAQDKSGLDGVQSLRTPQGGQS